MWSPGILMPAVDRGTLIVPRVDRLDDDQQRRLIYWLEKTAGSVRVIATTSVPLFVMVQRGVFLDRLYYLLNIIRLDLPA
jgi:DNA-binding NtrC family response regulator